MLKIIRNFFKKNKKLSKSKLEEIVISEFTLAKIDRSIFELEPYGAHEFKGISRPIETYKVRWNR